MAANSDLSDKGSANDWDTIPFKSPLVIPQDETDPSSGHADNPIEMRPPSCRYPQRDQRPVKRFELTEFCK